MELSPTNHTKVQKVLMAKNFNLLRSSLPEDQDMQMQKNLKISLVAGYERALLYLYHESVKYKVGNDENKSLGSLLKLI